MSRKEVNNLVLDAAEAVSYNEETAVDYLFENDVNIDDYLTRGLAMINLKSKVQPLILNKSQSFFRRAVLAAKIAHEYHNERTFGAVKFQKLVYLSEQISEMKFVSDYRKHAAGPMDHKFIHSIKKEFEKQNWFKVEQHGEYKKWVFIPQEKVLGYSNYYTQYYGTISSDIQFLIDTFREWKTDKVELIATLYACWLDAKNENLIISENLLIQKVYSWHDSKKKFSEKDIKMEINWMEENGVYPI